VTFEYAHAGIGETRRVVAENADEARNRLNAWCANEGRPLDGWQLELVVSVTAATPPEETRDGES